MKRLLVYMCLVAPLWSAPKNEQYSGKVLAVDEDYCNHTSDYVLRMTVITDSGVQITLVLAPKWFLHKQKVELRPGDKLEATVQKQSDGALHVIKLKVGTKSVQLRSAQGRPLWKPEPGSEDLFHSICKA